MTVSGSRISDAADSCEVLYSAMQLEVQVNGSAVFGIDLHQGFEGNMFSREHLQEYLPRIAASVAARAKASYARG